MGWGKQIGKCMGTTIGATIRIGTDVVGGLTKSEFIKEVGETAMQATIRTGERVGQVADGVGGTVTGIAKGDASMVKEGAKEAGGAVYDTAKGIVRGVGTVAMDGAAVVGGVVTGDTVAASEAGRRLLKAAAVSVLAVGIGDMIGIIDLDGDVPEGLDVDGATLDLEHIARIDVHDFTASDGLDNVHYVHAHSVSGYDRADGISVEDYWRGDQDPGLDVPDVPNGYLQSNPNDTPLDNLDPARRIG